MGHTELTTGQILVNRLSNWARWFQMSSNKNTIDANFLIEVYNDTIVTHKLPRGINRSNWIKIKERHQFNKKHYRDESRKP